MNILIVKKCCGGGFKQFKEIKQFCKEYKIDAKVDKINYTDQVAQKYGLPLIPPHERKILNHNPFILINNVIVTDYISELSKYKKDWKENIETKEVKEFVVKDPKVPCEDC